MFREQRTNKWLVLSRSFPSYNSVEIPEESVFVGIVDIVERIDELDDEVVDVVDRGAEGVAQHGRRAHADQNHGRPLENAVLQKRRGKIEMLNTYIIMKTKH